VSNIGNAPAGTACLLPTPAHSSKLRARMQSVQDSERELSMARIRKVARQMKSNSGIDLSSVDYDELVEAPAGRIRSTTLHRLRRKMLAMDSRAGNRDFPVRKSPRRGRKKRRCRTLRSGARRSIRVCDLCRSTVCSGLSGTRQKRGL